MKKSHSLRFQLLAIVICVIIVTSILVGGIGMIEVTRYSDSSNARLLQTVCDNKADQIDALFRGLEKSVVFMQHYLKICTEQADIYEKDTQIDIAERTILVYQNVAESTDGAIAYYFSYNPTIADYASGVYFTKTIESSDFQRFTPIDVADYTEADAEAKWFWQAKREEKGVWLMPYVDPYTDIMIVSYALPVYLDNLFVGVVGMDFDYSELTKRVDEIEMYEKGFAFLAHGDHIAYLKNGAVRDEIPDFSEDYMQVSRDLRNGMTLVVLAHYDDLYAAQRSIVAQIVIGVSLIVVIISLLMLWILRHFLRPIKALTNAALRVADGDYNITAVSSKTKEVEILGTSFAQMTSQLLKHDRQQHQLAYRDSLTGLRNSTSFWAWVEDFDAKIGDTVTAFGVMVLDLNYLKQTNDTYGHDMGNRLIVAAARIISDVFKRSPVFRVGGDEFIVILCDADLRDYADLIDLLDRRSSEEFLTVNAKRIPVSIAHGIAFYHTGQDTNFMSVFNRADTEMYCNKRVMKSKEKV